MLGYPEVDENRRFIGPSPPERVIPAAPARRGVAELVERSGPPSPLPVLPHHVTGAVLIALNVGVVGLGFMLFLVSSELWTVASWVHREPSLVVLQGAFTVINVLGVYRWALA